MGITERHWFEDEEPELTDRQLEDVISIQDRVYRRGYNKGYSDRNKEIVRCKDCKYRGSKICPFYQKYQGEKYDDWFCADGKRKNS